MKNKERYDQVQEVVNKLHDIESDVLDMAKTLDVEEYPNFGDRARYLVGQAEQLAHDIFQRNLSDNA